MENYRSILKENYRGRNRWFELDKFLLDGFTMRPHEKWKVILNWEK